MRTAAFDGIGPGAKGRLPRVVKVGGREIVPGPQLDRFAAWVAHATEAGTPLVLVHGGGDEVTALADRLGIPTEKVQGQRVTTPQVLPLVEQVLGGEVNLRLVAALVRQGVPAFGLTGVSSSIVEARVAQGGRLGAVGEPTKVNASLLEQLLSSGLVPVLAPLATDGKGGVLNVNADLFAEAVARALGAELMLVTDVPGVQGPSGSLLGRLTPSAIHGLLADGTIHGGMVPKVQAAVLAISGGLRGVWIGQLSEHSPSSPLGGTWILPDAALGPSAAGPGATTNAPLYSPRGASSSSRASGAPSFSPPSNAVGEGV